MHLTSSSLSTGTLEESVAIVICMKLVRKRACIGILEAEHTVKVLPIELLDELEHHAIQSPSPQVVSCRETSRPCRLPAFVFNTDTKHQLFHRLLDDCIVDRHTVELRNDLAIFLYSACAEKVATAIR